MNYKIVGIRLDEKYDKTVEHITYVKLSNNEIQKVSDVVRKIDQGDEYYYTTGKNSKATVITVHSENGKHAFIRTKGNFTKTDNLLSLDPF